MTTRQSNSSEWALELRQEFDRSFHEPAAERPDSPETLLAVRIGAQPHALRLRQISGLLTDCVITEVPTRVASLLGVTALRGTILPVFSLSALLGYPASRRPRWMALVGTDERIGLAFDQLEGHIRADAEHLVHTTEASTPRDMAGNVARCGPTIRLVVDLDPLLAKIPRRVPDSGASRTERIEST